MTPPQTPGPDHSLYSGSIVFLKDLFSLRERSEQPALGGNGVTTELVVKHLHTHQYPHFALRSYLVNTNGDDCRSRGPPLGQHTTTGKCPINQGRRVCLNEPSAPGFSTTVSHSCACRNWKTWALVWAEYRGDSAITHACMHDPNIGS